jgi:general secretion pathway protein I
LPRSTSSKRREASAGFTLIEVLVALSVLSVSLAAIGSLIATTVRGTRSLEAKLNLVETARAIEAGLPQRDQLAIGTLSGERNGYRWRVDVMPFMALAVQSREPPPWIPQTVVISVQAPGGPTFQVNTVRLRRRTAG